MNLFYKIFKRGHNNPAFSIIIPFRTQDDFTRDRVFFKIEEYYKKSFPEAEVIVSTDPLNSYPFNKSAAINAGVRRSTGEVIAVIDADCYLEASRIRYCVHEIKEGLRRGEKIWYVPYTDFHRVTQNATIFLLNKLLEKHTWKLLVKNFCNPFWVDTNTPVESSSGHRYGAMIQIMPREAFDLVGGWNEIFNGWGSEDVAMLCALNTLYAPNRLEYGPVFHLWHHVWRGPTPYIRKWLGQDSIEQNFALAGDYYKANGNPQAMRKLVEQSLDFQTLRQSRGDD